MPVVNVSHVSCCTEEELDAIALALPHLVASMLSAEGDAELTRKDVTVIFQQFGPRDSHTHDVEVVVLAHDYKVRRNNADQRAQAIANNIDERLPYRSSLTGYVWVLLAPTGFANFGPRLEEVGPTGPLAT